MLREEKFILIGHLDKTLEKKTFTQPSFINLSH